MVIYSIYVVSKSGGLIFNHDHTISKTENEKQFMFPLDLNLKYENKRVIVEFGQKEGIRPGHVLHAVNGKEVSNGQLDNGQDVFEILKNKDCYPLNLRFGRPKMTTNEKIFLASMFYPLFAIASQLSPEPKCSGIEILEADAFKLYCFQTLTGVKMMAVADKGQTGVETLLKKIYELYADYALKNPFYSLEMPIRCELFETNLKNLLEVVEKSGVANI